MRTTRGARSGPVGKKPSRRKRRHQFEAFERREVLTAGLVISEVNYDPYGQMRDFGDSSAVASDYEFLEIYNAGQAPANLFGHALVQTEVGGALEGVNFVFPNVTLPAAGRTVVVRNLTAFRSRYGQIPVAGQWSGGGLSNQGETLRLVNPSGVSLFEVRYESNSEWPTRANGLGASLVLKDLAGDPNDPKTWQSSPEYGGSPGRASAERVERVYINEILAHTDEPLVDAVEFRNVSSVPVNVGGWYFSDRVGNPFHYRLPRNTVIPAGGYFVIREQDFNPGGGLLPSDFALSERGEPLILISAAADGRPQFIEDYVVLSPTENGVSVGNVQNERDTVEMLPLEVLSFGAANGDHRVSPVVVSEIQYHPAGNNSSLEFVELRNTTSASVKLDDWRLDDALRMTIPPGTELRANEAIVLVPFSPADAVLSRLFREYYEIDERVRLFGPWGANSAGVVATLSNSGEDLTLRMPLDDEVVVVYAAVDRVEYRDSGDWPTVADGQGASLSRTSDDAYGNTFASWSGTRPSPGDQGPDLAKSPVLAVGVPVSGSIGFDNSLNRGPVDVDVYQFQPATTGDYRLVARGLLPQAVDTVLRVFATDGKELGFNDDAGGGDDSSLTLRLQAGSTYYIAISGASATPQLYNPFTGTGAVAGSMGGYEVVVEAAAPDPAPWHNRRLPEDVTGDGVVAPFDALLVINQLNEVGVLPGADRSGPPFFDVNADNILSPFDALLVINYLNSASDSSPSPRQTVAAMEASGEPVDASTIGWDPWMLAIWSASEEGFDEKKDRQSPGDA